MNAPLASFAALALCFAGMASLSLAMDRHHEQVTGRPSPSPRQRLACRAVGAGLLALALWPCIAAWGGSIGVVGWCGFLSVGALAVAWLLPYAPRFAVAAAAVTGAAALLVLTFA